jgi:hypothetical protein
VLGLSPTPLPLPVRVWEHESDYSRSSGRSHRRPQPDPGQHRALRADHRRCRGVFHLTLTWLGGWFAGGGVFAAVSLGLKRLWRLGKEDVEENEWASLLHHSEFRRRSNTNQRRRTHLPKTSHPPRYGDPIPPPTLPLTLFPSPYHPNRAWRCLW